MPANAVRNSSNIIIIEGLRKVKATQLKNCKILGRKNTYFEDAISKTDAFQKPIAPHVVNKDHIAQYLASSTFCHCYDGWNFLSRSIESLLNADISSSIHFAYYAELRAVMSLMAANGIGIFNKKHIYFDSAKADHYLNKRTHEIAKLLVEEWIKLPQNKEPIFRILKFSSFSLHDWISASRISATGSYISSIANDWFNKWSIDIQLQEDQRLRNEMSYRPHFNFPSVDIEQLVDKLISIWSSLEPTDSNRFQSLDAHLSRIALENLFSFTSGRGSKADRYKAYIDNICDNLGEPKAGHNYNFLLRNTDAQDHTLITEAKKDSKDKDYNLSDPLPMICRAIMLLRFSTGFTSNLMNSANIQKDNLKFWWEDIAQKIGLIDSLPSGIDTCDLFSDIRDSITNITNYSQPINSVKMANDFAAQDLMPMKQFQRVCFWGLGL